ncbi:MAG: peptidoglycan bridge formation glycyltransferase FemA/FemB family protein [Patescibacteria group bacterium]
MIPSYFQTDSWGKFKAGFGWTARRYDNLLGLARRLPLGKSMLYFPEIPFSEESIATIGKIIRDGTHKKHIFTRFEFLTPWSQPAAQTLYELGLQKSFEDVQPEHRQWVSLEGSEEEILKQMKPKGRYNVGVAERNNLQVKTGLTNQLLSDFFDLYFETAKRSKFSGRGAKYFQDLCNLLAENNQGEIVAVYQGQKALAAGIILYYGSMASYLYGGSVRQPAERSLMAPYLMHWEVMKRAKSRGCKIYDLLAISPPADAAASAAFNHPYAGLTRFKTQFGGQSIHLLGSWDLIGSRFWYTMYRFAERRRRKAF